MSECAHPPNRQRFWTISEVKTDGAYAVLDKRGRVIVREVMVGACCECGATLGERALRERVAA